MYYCKCGSRIISRDKWLLNNKHNNCKTLKHLHKDKTLRSACIKHNGGFYLIAQDIYNKKFCCGYVNGLDFCGLSTRVDHFNNQNFSNFEEAEKYIFKLIKNDIFE